MTIAFLRGAPLPTTRHRPSLRKPATCKLWEPLGQLRLVARAKEAEVATLERLVEARPDHPLSLRLGFVAGSPAYRLARALRRSDGTLAVLGGLRRRNVGEEVDEEPRGVDLFAKGVELLAAGADGLAVATDAAVYGGQVGDLVTIGRRLKTAGLAEDRPALVRQDFVVHPIQLAEAAEAGADAVMLVAGVCLPDLEELMNSATLMGLEVVVECSSPLEMEFAMEAGATLLCLSNLDRATNTYVAGRAAALRREVPEWITTIASGGVVTASDAWTLSDAGFDAVLMGGSLMRSPRPDRLIGEIRSRKRDMDQRFFGSVGYAAE